MRWGLPAPRSPSPTLVVGYDGSPRAHAALDYVGVRAGADARVVVVHAVPPPRGWPGSSVGEGLRAAVADGGELVLDQARRRLARMRTEGWVVEGDPVAALRETAGLVDAEELVVGARGGSGLLAGLGSVSRALLRELDRPLTIAPPPRQDMARPYAVRTMLVLASPGGAEPWLADAAGRTTRATGARLVVSGIDQTATLGLGGLRGGAARAASHVAARRLTARLRAGGLDVALGTGDSEAPPGAANGEVTADLIAVGAVPQSAVGEALCDGGAAALLERFGRPLMLVPGRARP